MISCVGISPLSTCGWCGRPVGRRQDFCSATHRQAAWRRHQLECAAEDAASALAELPPEAVADVLAGHLGTPALRRLRSAALACASAPSAPGEEL